MEAKLIKNRLFLRKVVDNYVLHRIKDGILTIEGDSQYTIGGIEPFYKLSLKNCQAIERGYDLDELAKEFVDYEDSLYHSTIKNTYMHGFQKALEIIGDKKFSEEDVMQLIKSSFYAGLSKGQGKNQDFNIDDYVKEHLQQTEWDVIIEMEDVFVHSPSLSPNQKSQWEKKPKLDAENCLILKRK